MSHEGVGEVSLTGQGKGVLAKNSSSKAGIFGEESKGAIFEPSNAPRVSKVCDTIQVQKNISLPKANQEAFNNIKCNQIIQYKNREDGNLVTAKVLSRAGKASKTSKYPHWWNIETTEEKFSMDLSAVDDLVVLPNVTLISSDELEAITAELDEWKKREVYTEVDDEGQKAVSLRWGIKDKTVNGHTFPKARLCARGFEEEQNFRTDSPTCSREGVRIALTLIASNSWKLNSIDVKTAFLQGNPIEREVFVKPPKEAGTNGLWKLNKCVYGLADASRYWYLKLQEELIKLGAKPSTLVQGIFLWYNNNVLWGITVCFVDDVLWGGDESFYRVIAELKRTFHIGTEQQTNFNYVGVKLSQRDDYSIEASQDEFIDEIEYIPITPLQKAKKDEPLSSDDIRLLRGVLGKLNWIAGMTRPEISFSVSQLSSHIAHATVSDLITANKVVKFVKSRSSFIKFPKVNVNNLCVKVFADASWNNLIDGGSQGGQIVFICDENNTISPILWSSNRVRRVARSTIAAESLSVLDGCDSAKFIGKLLEEILKKKRVPIIVYTDSNDLFSTSSTTKLVTERGLRVEISAIRQMLEREECKLVWIDKTRMLADVLTKKGAPSQNLMRSIQSGVISPATSEDGKIARRQPSIPTNLQ